MSCPNCGSSNTKKHGWHRNLQRNYQRYICKACGHVFALEELSPEDRREHRPELNDPVVEMHLQGFSQRDIADRLNCSRLTVIRKLRKYLG